MYESKSLWCLSFSKTEVSGNRNGQYNFPKKCPVQSGKSLVLKVLNLLHSAFFKKIDNSLKSPFEKHFPVPKSASIL